MYIHICMYIWDNKVMIQISTETRELCDCDDNAKPKTPKSTLKRLAYWIQQWLYYGLFIPQFGGFLCCNIKK